MLKIGLFICVLLVCVYAEPQYIKRQHGKPTTAPPTTTPAPDCVAMCQDLYQDTLTACNNGADCDSQACQDAYIAYFNVCNRNGPSGAYGSSVCYPYWQTHNVCAAKKKRTDCVATCGPLYQATLSACNNGADCESSACQNAYITYFNTCNRNGPSGAYGSAECFPYWQTHNVCAYKKK